MVEVISFRNEVYPLYFLGLNSILNTLHKMPQSGTTLSQPYKVATTSKFSYGLNQKVMQIGGHLVWQKGVILSVHILTNNHNVTLE